MIRLGAMLRTGVGFWIALCAAPLATGCGEGAASEPAHRAPSPDAEAAGVDSSETDSADPTRDLEKAPRIVGYLPTYRFGEAPPLHLDRLTHLILAFAVPNPEGDADFLDASPSDIERIVAEAHASKVKVLAALGGGAGGAATSARLDRGVDTYVASVVELVEKYALDGVDIDIEGDAIEPRTYEPLMLALSERLGAFPARKLLTAAVAAYRRENYRALGAVDFLNVMSYDQCGSWSERACEHSTLSQAQIDLEYWSNFTQADASGTPRTIGAENVVLGVPFYGRCWGERCPERPMNPDGTYPKTVDLSYASIAAYCAEGRFSGCTQSADVLTDGDEVRGHYVSFNGPDTLAKKAEMATHHGGIMIWELGQDAGSAPLFSAIENALPKAR